MNPIISMTASGTGVNCQDTRPVAVIDAVRSGRWRESVERIREVHHRVLDSGGNPNEAKAAVAAMKKSLPGVLPSGRFTTRAKEVPLAEKLTAHSGLLCADLDNLGERLPELRAQLINDTHVYALFTSPTGTGLKVWFRVCAHADKHGASFAAVQRHCRDTYGVDVDPACKEVVRLCFVSFDPEAHLNRNATELPPLPAEPKTVPTPPNTAPADIDTRRRIAGELLGTIRWTTDTAGFCACPGQHLHTTGNDPRDCEVHLDGAPTIHCFHSHCTGIVGAVNHELRSRVGKKEHEERKPHIKLNSVTAEYLGADGGEPEEPEPVWTAPPWPLPLVKAAFHGLAGDVIGVIDPHTEADPAAVLSMFLAAFGNMAGASAHFMAQAHKHPARVWPVLVGETAKGRKGSAWSSLRFLLDHVDEHWVEHCTASGLSSGEGLIWAVRDPIVRHKKNKEGVIEEYVEDEGVADKRMLTIEEEFSAVLKVAAREGNTVSDLLRRAWDHGDLRTMTKNSPARATGAHVTVIGHITKPDLARLLSETDALNGFGNRYLWLAVRRSKLLPDGGELHTANLAPLTRRLRQALDFARKAALIERSDAARDLWHERYPLLTADQPGLFGALTNRAEAQVMRLALIYALLDCSPQIDVVHLQAALAVWDFCHHSTRFLFGESLGDRAADRIQDELHCAGLRGLTRNDLREVFNRNLTSAKIEAALGLLHRQKLAHWSKEPRAGGGRPAIVWRCTPYAKNAIIAEPLPPTVVTAFTALGGQQPEAPPNNPIGDVGNAKDTKLQPLHDKKTLIEEFA
jgi:VirE N-terminal domain